MAFNSAQPQSQLFFLPLSPGLWLLLVWEGKLTENSMLPSLSLSEISSSSTLDLDGLFLDPDLDLDRALLLDVLIDFIMISN